MTARFEAVFPDAEEPSPSPQSQARTVDATAQAPPGPATAPDGGPISTAAPPPLPPSAQAKHDPDPPLASTPLGYGEVVLDERPPVLGQVDPFPFDAATGDAVSVPLPADPFAPSPNHEQVAGEALALGGPGGMDPFARPPEASDRAAEVPSSELPSGLGSLGPKEAEELEALFDEAGFASGPEEPAASPAATANRALYKVRRRSGRVFGPFTEAEVVEMLGKGELLGNEEISSDDGATFGGFGAVPAFEDTLRRLTQAPTRGSAPIAVGAGGSAKEKKVRKRVLPASLGWAQVKSKLSHKWLLPGGALAIVLAVCLGAGLTSYGVFFRFAVGQTGAHRLGSRLLAEARGRLADDDFAAVKDALDLADNALRLRSSDREAKAVYAYVASLLVRRHGGGGEAWTRAQTFLPELASRGTEDPEAAKALLSASLLVRDGAADVPAETLRRYIAKGARDDDALFVLGDAALARRDLTQAAGLYGRLSHPGAARASHSLGLVAEQRGDVVGAKRLFEAALSNNPRHLASAVELARLDLASGAVGRAEEQARRVLAPAAQGQAGPAERSQARTVLGQALVRQLGKDVEQALLAAEHELEEATREAPRDVEARLALSAFELDRNAPEKASAALAPVLALALSEPRIACAQARALVAEGRMLDALTLLEGAIERSPGDPLLLFAKGLAVYQGGKHPEGEKLWEQSLARAPEAWEPLVALGRAKLARGELDEAEKQLRLAAKKAPLESEALTGVADLLLAKADLAGAEGAYRRALSVAPAHAEAHLGLARVALARGNASAARVELELAIRLEPRLVAAQTAYGELLWKARDLTGAEKALKAAVALDPRDGAARGRLGAVEVDLGENDAAVSDLLAASNLEIGSPEIRFWFGKALLAKGEVPQAIEQLHKAVELEPRNASYELELGRAFERSSSLEEAVEAYRAAQARAPAEVEPYAALAALYAGQNRCADAVPLLERAIALAPKDQRLRVAAGDCKAHLGRYADAVAIYRGALAANPRLVGLYYKIGYAEHEAGNRNGAVAWFERAAREEPANPMSHYYLGFAYKERGERARAIEAFRAYLKGKPDADDRRDIESEIGDLGGRL
ncbi:MAG TPA: tetratricopeptide repeat protein [Anaeromyxobacteraceae bacterium]|nr:tetratricopeptide repeat protein [Anaeromyxobacteraceae bacterium]